MNAGVDKSTISREFSRIKGKRGWRPHQAQSLRDERKQACNNCKQFTLSEWAEVDCLIRKDLLVLNKLPTVFKWKADFRSVTKQSNSMYMLTNVEVAIIAVTCVARNHAAGVTRVGKNDVI
jgi:IS30 family transposase